MLLLSGLVALVTVTTEPARAAPVRTLNIGIVNLNVVTYNPLAFTLVDEYIVVYNVYSALFTYDKNWHIQPDLAYNGTLSPDGLTWTFHLVHNAYFTDPTNPTDRSHPVTSADVYFSYMLNINETASALHIYTDAIASMSTPDAYTFTITTTYPYAAMNATAADVVILPKYVWSGINNPVRYANSNPIGSGAMYLDPTTQFGTNIILRRNPNYYGDQDYCQFSRPDIVYYKDYSNAGSMVTDFKSGTSGLDAIMNVDPFTYLSSTGLGSWSPKFAANTGFIGEISINVMTPQIRASNSQFKNGYNNPLLLNDTVRLAVAMSINKTALIQWGLLGMGIVADTLIPTSNKWHYSIPASDQYHFDPLAARQLLMNAGWKWDSSGNPATSTTVPLYQKGTSNGTVYWPLSFRFETGNWRTEWPVMAVNITTWLAEAGIQTLNVQYHPGYSLLSESQMGGNWFTGDYDIWLWDWSMAPGYDPSVDIMSVETTAAIGPTSDNFYSNSTYDGIYNQSLQTMNPVTRRSLTDELQKMVYDYHSYILPYYNLDLYAATNGRPGTSPLAGWTNWGNWSQSQGLVPDSQLPVLWYQVAPLDNLPPVINSFPSVSYYNTIPTAISVSVTDTDSTPASSFSWDFGDGTYANTTTASVQHTYANVGAYTVKVRVSDGEFPACGSTAVTIAQYVPGQNLPPQALAIAPTLSNGSYGYVGLSQKFAMTVSDPDGDSIFVRWNFGDSGTGTSFLPGTPGTAVSGNVSIQHTYTAAGTYTVTANVTDNQTGGSLSHFVTRTAQITIQAASGGGGGGGGTPPPAENLWISYGIPLAIVAIVVIAAAVVMLRRRKRAKAEEKEAEGPPQGPSSPPPPSG